VIKLKDKKSLSLYGKTNNGLPAVFTLRLLPYSIKDVKKEAGRRESHGKLILSLSRQIDPRIFKKKGYFCVFTSRFLSKRFNQQMLTLPVFSSAGSTTYQLNAKDYHFAAQIFEKLLIEEYSLYVYKYELIKTYISQIIHLAMKMKQNQGW